MSRLGVAVIGLGWWGQVIVPLLKDSAKLRVVLGVDPRPEAAEFAEKQGIAHAEKFETALKRPDVQGVVLCTPHSLHNEQILKAAAAKKHVFCEKPLAMSRADVLKAVKACNDNKVALAVGHEKRFHHTLAQAGELLRAGAIGEPFHVGVHWASNAKLDPEALVPDGFRPGYEWRWRDQSVGGGLVQDHLPHYVDLLRHWTGLEPLTVYADCRNVARDVLGWPEEESRWEDFGLAVVQFEGALELRFETSVVGRSVSPIWALGSGVGEWTEYGYVLGSAGQLVFDLLPWDSSEHGRIALWQLDAAREGRGWTWIEQAEPPRRAGGASAAMFRAQAESWADLIEGRQAAIATGEDGAVALAAVEAAYASAARRGAVDVATRDGVRA